MAFSVSKVATFLGLKDDPELDQAQVGQEPIPGGGVAIRPPRVVPVRPVSIKQVALQPELSTIDRIVTLHPRTYSEARAIGEQYREGNPVIINLDDMDESERKRLVDFASGLAFGLRGGIEKITSVVFLISPANVIVRTEDKAAYAQASFYNQS